MLFNSMSKTKKTFYWHSTRQEGCTGAHEACHTQYMLPGAVVEISSYGRRHGGWITFSFFDQHGKSCSAADWALETHNLAPARGVKRYSSSGLSILLESSGRSHCADFTVKPARQDGCIRHRSHISLYAGAEVVDVLAASARGN